MNEPSLHETKFFRECKKRKFFTSVVKKKITSNVFLRSDVSLREDMNIARDCELGAL